VDSRGSASELPQTLNQGFPEGFQSSLPHGWHSQGTLAANFDYELDLFGKNRAEFAAATSEADASRIDAAAARLRLSQDGTNSNSRGAPTCRSGG
jgi:outer membrane protein TolC